MRSLSATLLAAQKQASASPYVELKAKNKITDVVRLDWARLYTDAEDDYYHALTMPGDGSLIRVRVTPPADGRKLYRQRVADPGPASDFSTWTYTNQYNCVAVAVASLGAEVSIFWVNSSREIRRLKSVDYGVTWGSPELIDYSPSTAVSGIAAAYKPNGDLAIFFADQATLYIKKYVAGSWQAKSAWDKTTGDLSSVACVYDGDWNLLVSGRDAADDFKLWSLVYGDGGAVPANTWSELKEFVSAPSGGDFEYSRVFLDKPDVYRLFYVEKFAGTQSYSRPFWSHAVPATAFLTNLWREPVPFDLSSQYGLAMAHHGDYFWLSSANGVWRASLVGQSLDLTADILSLRQELAANGGGLTVELRNDDGRYATPGQGSLAILQIGCQLEFSPGYLTTKAVETLRPNAAGDETNILSQFPDAGEHWDKVDEEVADGNGTRIQDYRPTYQRDLYHIQDPSAGVGSISAVKVFALCRCGATPNQASLKIVIKSCGVLSESPEITVAYSLANFTRYSCEWSVNPATGVAWTRDDVGNLQVGVALRSPQTGVDEWTICTQVYVEVHYGGTGEVSSGQSFMLKAYEHTSSGGRASLVLHALDAWDLIKTWKARHQFRWNKGASQWSVKQILEFVLARVGLKLEVVSQSSVITGYYPDFTINPNDQGDAVISKLLSFVPDVLFIEGGKAYLVNPQASDSPVYSYGTSHPVSAGGYHKGAWQHNWVQVEGYDAGVAKPIVVNSFSWGEISRLYDRLSSLEDRNIDTVSKAQERGEAHLRHAEIESASGVILIPVNCGQQLYDVIEVTDSRAGLNAAKKRVLGLTLVYHPGRGRYEQRLSLGAV